MSPEQITMLEKLMNSGFANLENLIKQVNKSNNEAHERFEKHFVKLNGQTAKNSEHRIKQQTTNKWIYGLMTIIVIPILFLILKQYV